MKVSLIVVQGKPEGKVIPLAGPNFKIGRGEGCHLRPNNEQVSREHTEIVVRDGRVFVRDLGSRNGTFLNNGRIEGEVAAKASDLIQVGPLVFALSIQLAPAAAGAPVAPERAAAKATSLDDVSHAEIEAWLVSDMSGTPPERPSGIYAGDTQTLSAYKGGIARPGSDPVAKAARPAPPPAPAPPPPPPVAAKPAAADDEEETYEQLPEGAGDDEEPQEEVAAEAQPEELIDENNPFYVAKKAVEEPAKGPSKQSWKDSSEAADTILRKMMERRRASR